MTAEAGGQKDIDRVDTAAETESRVFAGLVDQLYSHSSRTKYLPFAVLAVASIVFLPVRPIWTTLVILAVQAIGTIGFDILRHYYRRARARHENRRPWARRFALMSAVTGASWGLAGVLWFVPGSVAHQSLLALIICGILTGSVLSRGIYPPALYTFVAAATVAPVIRLVIEGSTGSLVIAVLSLFFMAGLFGWARGIHKTAARELAFRARNRALAWELAKARDEAMVRAAEAQRALVAAEAGERTKSEFLSTISHEVRTPLNGIKGMSELLQDTELTETQRDYLKTIQDSAEALRVVLEDVLELSRLEGASDDVEEAVFDPRAIAEEVVRIVAPEAERKHLSISVTAAHGVPPGIHGDPRRVRQILLNLIGNAIKFTDTGSVVVSLAATPLDEKRIRLRFDVRDTGIGVPRDALPRLFERFAQVDQSITRRHGGKGLGLALCKRLALQMEGDIEVESEAGRGSTFSLVLPARVASAAPHVNGAGTGEAQVDTAVLEALEAKIGLEKTVGIIEAYLDTAWQLAERIGKSSEAGDVDDIARAAHDLKSAAGNLGLASLSEAASMLQLYARTGDKVRAIETARTIPDETARAHDALVHAYPAAMR